MTISNPFEITKAVDYSDQEIKQSFVSYPKGGYGALADPKSKMPMLIVGGKGGGRTHLMRNLSSSLQKLRGTDLFEQVRNDGYLGVYFRCSGLNASRFEGKRHSPEQWRAVFAYYMDVWLAALLVENLQMVASDHPGWGPQNERDFAKDVYQVLEFDDASSVPDSLDALRLFLRQLQRSMDRTINNVALRGSLDAIDIRSTPGRLIFESARATAELLPGFADITVTFLIDEFENLTLDQQIYFNTLIREKKLPSNFLVGSRRYGVKTYLTFSGEEKNKIGSEFEEVVVEDFYGSDKSAYLTFCRELVLKRLESAGFPLQLQAKVDDFFPNDTSRFHDEQLLEILESTSKVRRHISQLRGNLDAWSSAFDINAEIVESLQIPEHPLLEKLAILRFYQKWHASGSPSLADARDSRDHVYSLTTDKPFRGAQQFLKHWGPDMMAQLYEESGKAQPYLGFEKYVDMSAYLPRCLLIILKSITRWSMFFAERPFEDYANLSEIACRNGVRDASDWFANDALPAGREGSQAEAAIDRLGGFLRTLRFVDKPVEVSLCTITTDLVGISDSAKECLFTCAQYSLLLEQRGGRDRNTRVDHRRYQINPMLSPKYDLPVARRGVIQLSVDEMNAIFGTDNNGPSLDSLTETRLRRMNAPFSRMRPAGGEALFEID